jgi:hypothetical protein
VASRRTPAIRDKRPPLAAQSRGRAVTS